MPFRSLGHYNFVLQLERKGKAQCEFVRAGKGVQFLVAAGAGYRLLDITKVMPEGA
jgi:hypothetical protein